MYAMFPEKPVRYLAHVWNLANRIFPALLPDSVSKAVILGSMFFVSIDNPAFSICNAGDVLV